MQLTVNQSKYFPLLFLFRLHKGVPIKPLDLGTIRSTRKIVLPAPRTKQSRIGGSYNGESHLLKTRKYCPRQTFDRIWGSYYAFSTFRRILHLSGNLAIPFAELFRPCGRSKQTTKTNQRENDNANAHCTDRLLQEGVHRLRQGG